MTDAVAVAGAPGLAARAGYRRPLTGGLLGRASGGGRGVAPGVVLEQQATGRRQDPRAGDDHEPDLQEGERDGGDHGRQRDAQWPVAAWAEEAKLASALGDLRVAPVLRPRVDPPGHEPEV